MSGLKGERPRVWGCKDPPAQCGQVGGSERVKVKKFQEDINGTIKAAFIEDSDNLPSLLAGSIYYTKPVHILITFTENIPWTKNVNMG